jgi:hypothetical protein
MKTAIFSMLLFAATSFAQNAIPAGTILPVQLNSSLRSDRLHVGETVSARVMQDVPLAGGSNIHAGAKVIGHVVAVQPETDSNPARISLRFDTLKNRGGQIPITTNLRALAVMAQVSEAKDPESGPDRGTSEYNWTTDQIGGEIAIHGGSGVFNGSSLVGHTVPNGVLVRASAKPDSPCRGEVGGNDRAQAMWVFSSDACGLYGFPRLALAHSGRTNPVGEVILESDTGGVTIPSGSGLLLRVNGTPAAQ